MTPLFFSAPIIFKNNFLKIIFDTIILWSAIFFLAFILNAHLSTEAKLADELKTLWF